jgi:hypothetical protein
VLHPVLVYRSAQRACLLGTCANLFRAGCEAAFGKMTMLELAWDCSAQVFEVICTQRSSCTAWTPVFIMEVVEIATAELADKLFGSVMRLWRREMA